MIEDRKKDSSLSKDSNIYLVTKSKMQTSSILGRIVKPLLRSLLPRRTIKRSSDETRQAMIVRVCWIPILRCILVWDGCNQEPASNAAKSFSGYIPKEFPSKYLIQANTSGFLFAFIHWHDCLSVFSSVSRSLKIARGAAVSWYLAPKSQNTHTQTSKS